MAFKWTEHINNMDIKRKWFDKGMLNVIYQTCSGRATAHRFAAESDEYQTFARRGLSGAKPWHEPKLAYWVLGSIEKSEINIYKYFRSTNYI